MDTSLHPLSVFFCFMQMVALIRASLDFMELYAIVVKH